MAHGGQDWIGRINIFEQALEKIIQRPNLGTIKSFAASGAVTPNAQTLAWYLSGAGIHCGIYFWFESTGIVDNDYLHFDIDDSLGKIPTFGELSGGNFIRAVGSEPTTTLRDDVNFRYAGFGGWGKTWNNHHSFYYVETYGRSPVVHVNFIYQLF